MFKIGCHLSSSKGFEAMGKTAVALGATTFQFFTRNPRGSKAKEIQLEDVRGLLKMMKEHGMETIVAHAPYTMNVCSANEDTCLSGNCWSSWKLLKLLVLYHRNCGLYLCGFNKFFDFFAPRNRLFVTNHRIQVENSSIFKAFFINA